MIDPQALAEAAAIARPRDRKRRLLELYFKDMATRCEAKLVEIRRLLLQATEAAERAMKDPPPD